MGRWMLLIAGAEALAFGLGGAFAGSGAGAAASFAAVAVAEIPLLCTAQWFVLRDRLPRLRWSWWTLATGTVAALTWGAAIAASSAGAQADAPEPPLLMQLTGYAVLGAAAGALMGGAQWLVLRRIGRPGAWVAWSTLAWAAGMPVSSLVIGSLPAQASMVEGLLYGIAAGAGMGAVVAALLWPAARRLAPDGRISGRLDAAPG